MRIALDGRMLTPREEIVTAIEYFGHIVDSDVTSETNFLVQSDTPGSRITNKLREAVKNKVEIITESQLYLLLRNK